jgi:predicted esterase YcpF (UPF0227 family)
MQTYLREAKNVNLSDWISALNDTDEDKYHRKHEQEMDEPAKRVRSEQTHGPKNQEQYCDGIKHGYALRQLMRES